MWLPDKAGVWERRYPTQILEGGWTAVILVGVLAWRPVAEPPGSLFLLAAMSYAAGRIGLELLRKDAALTVRATRLNLLVSVAIVLVAAWALPRL